MSVTGSGCEDRIVHGLDGAYTSGCGLACLVRAKAPLLYNRDLLADSPWYRTMDIQREPQGKWKRYVYGAVAAIAVAALTIWVSRLEAAPPTVERSTIWTGKVQRGEMLRQVRGPGTLVPEDVLNVTARTAGRVERILVLAGTAIDRTRFSLICPTLISNYRYRTPFGKWQRAEASYTELKVRLETQKLQQES